MGLYWHGWCPPLLPTIRAVRDTGEAQKEKLYRRKRKRWLDRKRYKDREMPRWGGGGVQAGFMQLGSWNFYEDIQSASEEMCPESSGKSYYNILLEKMKNF